MSSPLGDSWFAAESLPSRKDFWRAARGEFRFMAGNHTGERKNAAGKNGQRNHAENPEQKAAKKNGQKNGRGISIASGSERKVNGRSAAGAPAGTLFVIGGAED